MNDRIDLRGVKTLGPVATAALVAWSFVWLGLVWAAATGRL